MRYTERHEGKAVIRDKSLLPDALEILATIEELECVPAFICNRYCKYPYLFEDQEALDAHCSECKLWWLSAMYCILNSYHQ